MNERLLNENEITKIVGWPSAFEYAKIMEIITAQDRKTTAALIAQIENHHCEDCTMQDDVNGCTFADISCDWWQLLKEKSL